MDLEKAVLERVENWESFSRWEKSELGKDLRRLGFSYGEIMELVPVKKSTLATWCRDVALTDEQIAAIKERRAPLPGIPRNTNRKRLAEIAELRFVARQLVPDLISDSMWVAGLVLYWAEGNKSRSRIGMANTDPRVLRLFIRWIRTYVEPQAEFGLHLHLHEGNDEAAARKYWSSETGLDSAKFIKSFIKPRGTGHRKNHLEHGVCTVRMRRPADAWNIVMEWIDAVAEQFELGAPTH